MAAMDRLRQAWAARRVDPARPTAAGPGGGDHGAAARERAVEVVDDQVEAALWAALREDPNDEAGFHQLAEVVRRRAGEGHVGGDLQRAMDDAVWSLSEELAHSGRAWYPLIELARLSVHDDREAALRRLGTAAEREPDGVALARGLRMLRDERLPGDALNLGVGHWRPREHDLEVGRELVEAALECGRIADARRHLKALESNPDAAGVQRLRAELEPLIERAAASVPPGTPAGGLPLIDLREVRESAGRNPFRRR